MAKTLRFSKDINVQNIPIFVKPVRNIIKLRTTETVYFDYAKQSFPKLTRKPNTFYVHPHSLFETCPIIPSTKIRRNLRTELASLVLSSSLEREAVITTIEKIYR